MEAFVALLKKRQEKAEIGEYFSGIALLTRCIIVPATINWGLMSLTSRSFLTLERKQRCRDEQTKDGGIRV